MKNRLQAIGIHSLAAFGALIVTLTAPPAVVAADRCAPGPGNPYQLDATWPTMPAGRSLGPVSAVTVDRAGAIWVADRCGANSCATSSLSPVFKFDPSGKLLANFGAGLFAQPHGITVDRDGNVWVADDQSESGKGQQVLKLSQDGAVLMRLGMPGIATAELGGFNQPTSIAIAPNGDIFVAEGHAPSNGNSRIMKFASDGRFLATWGSKGSVPGQFMGPHGLAFDSKGRLYVADRGNNRVTVFDQRGKQLDEMTQFGSPGGLFIDGNDILYVADSSSTPQVNPGCERGIWVADLKSGKVLSFIPDPNPPPGPLGGTTAAEGVAADLAGNVYGAEVFAKDVKKYRPGR
jgi:DNA-binding beta-propeller fold protein YncE